MPNLYHVYSPSATCFHPPSKLGGIQQGFFIRKYYQTGTEFIIFLFTSDWFLGRDDFVPLPMHLDNKKWKPGEIQAVAEADALMGDTAWRESLLASVPVQNRETAFINLYKARLRKWFRYVLPLPFNPKGEQLYHLIICSNYEAGVRVTRQFYSLITNNPLYSPESTHAYKLFKSIHSELVAGLPGNRRPLAWKLLWQTIRDHEDGVCDRDCSDIRKTESDIGKVDDSLTWLHKQGYLLRGKDMNCWGEQKLQYAVNWKTVHDRIRIQPPTPFQPISAEQLRDNIAAIRVSTSEET